MVGGSQLAHRAPHSCVIFFQPMSSYDILCVGIFPSLASNHGDLVKGVATNGFPFCGSEPLGVVTPLPSPLLFSENGLVARRDWLFGGGGDSFSENGERRFFSSRGEEVAFSILRECKI